MGHWNHRMVQLDEDCIRIQEVYYDDQKLPCGYCDSSIQGETVEEVKADYKLIKSALNKPVLQLSEFKGRLAEPGE